MSESRRSHSLRTQVEQHLRENPGLTMLEQGELATITGQVAARHVLDPGLLWWWTSLREGAWRIEYARSDGLELLRRVLTSMEGSLILMITDDDPPPWIGVRGNLEDLLALLGELWCCEYFMCDSAGSWIVFDTHHDCLIGSGLPKPER